MKRLACALVLVASLAYGDDTITYRVKDGDTLALIAAEYYGDRRKEIFIMVENGIAHTRKLKRGERLKIPVNREITTSPGDTFETLAASFLGDARRAIFLAEFNGMSLDDGIPAGTQLQIPFTVTHRAATTESFQSIALAYFADKSQAEMLRRYNFMNDRRELEKGEAIQIPVYNVRLQASKMPPVEADAKSRRAARREAAQRAAQNLPKAWQAWRSGEFKSIEPQLFGVDIDYLDTAQAVEVAILRGLAAVADGNSKLAVEHFRAALARKDSYVLRAFDYSPKILALWKQAGGSTD